MTAGKALYDIAQEITALVAKATKTPDAVPRVLLYLEAARASVQALGTERQQILTAIWEINLRDQTAVESLTSRLHRYLSENKILRPL